MKTRLTSVLSGLLLLSLAAPALARGFSDPSCDGGDKKTEEEKKKEKEKNPA
jgi:hypothetical protein